MWLRNAYILVTMLMCAGLSPPLFAQENQKADTLKQTNKPAATDADQATEADELPVPIKQVPPVYPNQAKFQNISGKVYVKVLIGVDGLPKDVQILRSDAKQLNDAAMEAVMQWRFKPATFKGKPTVFWVVIPFQFLLQK